jgi:hypothetical protein
LIQVAHAADIPLVGSVSLNKMEKKKRGKGRKGKEKREGEKGKKGRSVCLSIILALLICRLISDSRSQIRSSSFVKNLKEGVITTMTMYHVGQSTSSPCFVCGFISGLLS